MTALLLGVALFGLLPLALGWVLAARLAWIAWIALAAFMVTAQALSGEVGMFTVLVALLAMIGGLFVQLGLRFGGPGRRDQLPL